MTISTEYTQLTNSTITQATTSAAAPTKQTETPSAQQLKVGPDTVEISAEGRAAMAAQQAAAATQQAPAAQAMQQAEQSVSSDSTANQLQRMAEELSASSDTEAISAAVSSATESTSDSSDLTSLSEQELKQLLADGEISQAQLAAELARRSGQAQQTQQITEQQATGSAPTGQTGALLNAVA